MLHKLSTKAPKELDKEKIKQKTTDNFQKINVLQNILYAQKKYSLLIILQGVDASGKDGAIRSMFSGLNPLGCRLFSYKKPTENEYNHDFLWRIHNNTPEKGMIHIFNRSHYEDILVPGVEKYLPETLINKRFELINFFEKIISHNDTIILKFYLHVSREKQLERLEERITQKEKFWKHNDGDWETRKKWDAYMEMYEQIFKKCSDYEWNIIPSDQNWYKDHLISQHILKTLEKLNLSWPELKTELF